MAAGRLLVAFCMLAVASCALGAFLVIPVLVTVAMW
jgi:hypothetical protein